MSPTTTGASTTHWIRCPRIMWGVATRHLVKSLKKCRRPDLVAFPRVTSLSNSQYKTWPTSLARLVSLMAGTAVFNPGGGIPFGLPSHASAAFTNAMMKGCCLSGNVLRLLRRWTVQKCFPTHKKMLGRFESRWLWRSRTQLFHTKP